MKPLRAKKIFELNDKYYKKGDEVQINNIEQLILLNEKGFIEPLTAKEIQNYIEEFNKGGNNNATII